jgi:hypothetical protein
VGKGNETVFETEADRPSRKKIQKLHAMPQYKQVRVAECLALAKIGEDRVDELEGLVDLFPDLGSSENDLA